MKSGLSRLHWLKWWVLFDTVIRSAVLINPYNFIHERFTAFLYTERQFIGHHRTQQSSVFCMQEVAWSSLGPETSHLDWGLLWFPTVPTANIKMTSDVGPRPLPPRPFTLIMSLPTYNPRYWLSLNKPRLTLKSPNYIPSAICWHY